MDSKVLFNVQYGLFVLSSISDGNQKDNACIINTDASMGIMLKLGAEGAKYFVDNYVLPEEFAAADRENWIHIHEKVVA